MIGELGQSLPYALIGKVVVFVVAVVVGLAVLAGCILGLLWLWVRGWSWVSNRMYVGYEITPVEERPPLWRMRISGVALALARFQFRKVRPAYREAETLTDDETTLRAYLSSVFLD